MRYSSKKKNDGTIIIVDNDKSLPKAYSRPMYSFSPSGGSFSGLATPKQAEKNLGKKHYSWEEGGKHMFIQAVFYPASIGNTRKERNKQLMVILKAELKSHEKVSS